MDTPPNEITNKPIRIDYSLSLSGPVAENTKAVKLAHSIWEEDILNRPTVVNITGVCT